METHDEDEKITTTTSAAGTSSLPKKLTRNQKNDADEEEEESENETQQNDDEANVALLFKEETAVNKNNNNAATILGIFPQTAGDNVSSNVEFSLVQNNTLVDSEAQQQPVYFEPPYTAPLAPFNMELMEHIEKSKQNAKLHLNLRNTNKQPQLQQQKQQPVHVQDNSDSALFMQNERAAAGAAGDGTAVRSESQKLNGDRNKYADESQLIDSTTSTVSMPEDETQFGFNNIPNNHQHPNQYPYNNSYYYNNINSQYSQKHNTLDTPTTAAFTSTPILPMTDYTLSSDNNYINDDCSCPKEFYQRAEINYSLFFDDGIRSIDFVLAYKEHQQPETEAENAEKRRVFEDNLKNQGLEIERVLKEKEQIYFVKLHAPLEVLRRYAEILKLRMPMKEFLCNVNLLEKTNRLQNAAQYLSRKIPGLSSVKNSTGSIFAKLKYIFSFFVKKINIDEEHFPKRTHRFTAIYSRDKEYLFDIRQDCFFTTAVRSRIVQFILDRQRFPAKSKDEMAFGIDRLVADNVYCAAYPLHDGEVKEKGTSRESLYTHWASINKWYRHQPLDYVKEYFGVKIGLYFAWLGYYTYMLLLASIVGVICFVYSWATLKDYVPVKDICHRSQNFNTTMCPLCDWCDFWDLKETCAYAKISYLIDNPSTVFFAVFMSFWATLFLELWKRYSAEITHRWDLTGFDVHEEHPRPQYLARLEHVPKTRTNYVTNMKEPTVPFWRVKLPATVFSFSVVLLLIALAFVALLAVVVYRMLMVAVLKVGSDMTTPSAIMLATASAAFVNLCLLYILNYFYNILAEYLTELELWRTQTQFDDSLTLKIYLLQFVNYYASIFYIAFFKGKFVGHPGQYNKLFDYRQEECSSGGCLTELCIQLAIIMIGKQAFNTILEVIMPMFWRRVLAIQVGLSRLFKRKDADAQSKKGERWLRDLKLLDWGPRSLFPEYLEMVLQYGFVTIFVAAFPLAPFFALLNNILEMRLDAKKLLTHHKRPVSQRVRDIGVWYRILDCIGKLSVITNGFIIAFTSDMIPRWVYRGIVSQDGSLNGYVDFTLSQFKINDSITLSKLAGNSSYSICRYTDFRQPPGAVDEYQLKSMYYIILACRLGFVVLFENFVALVMILVRWCIPDMTVELRDQIRREIYITNEIIIEQEAKRARFERAKRSSSIRMPEQDTASIQEPIEQFIKIEKLLSGNLSQSQMDLIIHGENAETGISGTSG